MPSNPSLPAEIHLAFVGGGNMARALIGGLLRQGLPAARICASEPAESLRTSLGNDFGITVTADNAEAVANADCVVLAVKPQVMRQVCEGLRTCTPADAVVVSIAAGITAEQLDRWLGGSRKIVRCMPNTPALLGHGASGLYANAICNADDRQLAASLLSAVGMCAWIEQEPLMDVVTALSGSGPAYAFLLAEAMAESATSLGLPEEIARQLSAQTLLGAAHMLSSSGEEASVLRARVTSPGGTTQAAIETFERGGLRALVFQALEAASRRGAELSASVGG